MPPRPQLSYPVRQQRAIMGELLADRDNARYTEQVIRHRAGLSTLPPPPGPPATDHEPAVEALIAAAPPVEPESAEPEPMGQQAPPRNVADIDRGNRDDGSLDDMIEGMVVEAEDDEPATAPAETRLAPSAGPQPAPTPPTAAPPQEMESETGPVSRLLDWLGGLVEGEEDRASVAVGPSPEAPEPRPLAAAAADAHPIEPAAGDAPAELAQEIAGPAPPEARPAGAPAPAPEASTITVAASGIGIVPAEPAGDPDPGVIAFARGSAALPPAALPKLERFLAEASVDDAPITVLGEGSPPALAIDRARAVGQALVSLGASAERLRITMATDGAGDRARLRLAAPAED